MKNWLSIILIILTTALIVSCSNDEKKTAEELNAEALSLFENNKTDKAIEKGEKALRKASEQFGQNNIAIVGIIENLAKYYFAKTEHDQAEFLYKKALAIVVADKGQENMDAAKIMNNIAGLYYVEGKHEQAAALFKQTLAIVEKQVGSDDPILATLRKNIERSSSGGEAGESGAVPAEFTEAVKTYLNEDYSMDQVPQQVKDHAIKELADNKMTATNLKPMPPVYMGNKGLVFPYRCDFTSEAGNKKGILLFAAVKSTSGENKVVFQQCRPVLYDSYADALTKGGINLLRKEISKAFQELFS
jgi:tetratricopeptide (TPR) repeat protein